MRERQLALLLLYPLTNQDLSLKGGVTMPEWQSMTIDEVIRELNTNPHQGLSAEEAKARLEKHGLNEVRTLRSKGPNRILSGGLKGTIITILSLAVLISVLLKVVFGT
jgi:Ca2+-transporting ATPase